MGRGVSVRGRRSNSIRVDVKPPPRLMLDAAAGTLAVGCH